MDFSKIMKIATIENVINIPRTSPYTLYESFENIPKFPENIH